MGSIDGGWLISRAQHLKELNESLRGFFLLLPDIGSLTAMLRAIRVG